MEIGAWSVGKMKSVCGALIGWACATVLCGRASMLLSITETTFIFCIYIFYLRAKRAVYSDHMMHNTLLTHSPILADYDPVPSGPRFA
jgi:hypothetical protein